MIFIKLSAHHKIVAIGTAILLVVFAIAFATDAVSNNTEPVKNEPTSKTDTSVTQSYEPETRDECIETTEITAANSTIAFETNEIIETTVVIKEIVPPTHTKPTEEHIHSQSYTEQDAIDIAKVLYNECRGVSSRTEQACVAWTILNRVDSYGSTVYSVVRSPNQFTFYESTPVWDDLLKLAHDVLSRWSLEKSGASNVGRVLPREYIYFSGSDGHNYFRDNYEGLYNIWDYSLESPYDN